MINLANIAANTVKLIVVTKGRGIEEMEEALKAGATRLGENRVQEAENKWGPNCPLEKRTFERHLIGHLQTNKVAPAVRLFDVIQSVDSIKLAEKLDQEAGKMEKVLRIYLQVNIGKEAQKHGFAKEEVEDALKKIERLKHIKCEGLMAMVPYSENPEETRPYFRAMKTLHDTVLPGGELSMGMSHDYRVAMQEGATMVRIGSAIFDPPL